MLDTLDKKIAPKMMSRAKGIVYRTPIAQRILFPKYPYWVDPGTLTGIVNLINENKQGAIIEIGVGRGITSAFILEHLKSTKDPRTLYLVDTFDSFTKDSIQHEVEVRGKNEKDIADFSYGSPKAFAKSLNWLGYENFKIIHQDCTKVD